MRTVETEFFGDENKVALSKKISALWRIVEHDHRYESHGRGIGIHYGDDTDVTHLADLAHLLGHAACAGVPNSKVDGYLAELGELGLKGALFELGNPAQKVWMLLNQLSPNVRFPTTSTC